MSKILIVGQNPPSVKAEKSKNGTATMNRLKMWCESIGIDSHKFINCSDDRGKTFTIDYDRLLKESNNNIVIALGNVASDALKKVGVKHFKMPHPSPMNRQLNDKEFEKQQLMKLYLWLKQQNNR